MVFYKSLIAFFVLSSAISSCFFDKSIETSIISDKKLNQNINGNGSSLILQFIQLKERSRFDRSSQFTLHSDPKKTLREDLIEHKKYKILPQSEKYIEIVLKNDCKYLAIIGGFRAPYRDKWKKIFLVEDMKRRIYLKLDKNTLDIISRAKYNSDSEKIIRIKASH